MLMGMTQVETLQLLISELVQRMELELTVQLVLHLLVNLELLLLMQMVRIPMLRIRINQINWQQTKQEQIYLLTQ